MGKIDILIYIKIENGYYKRNIISQYFPVFFYQMDAALIERKLLHKICPAQILYCNSKYVNKGRKKNKIKKLAFVESRRK